MTCHGYLYSFHVDGVDLYMADATEVGRPRGSGTLLGSNTRKSCKHFRSGGAWSHSQEKHGKAAMPMDQRSKMRYSMIFQGPAITELI
jgi:hypothetical protein